MLHLHLSNRPEPLAAALGALLRADPLPLLETEAVVTPSTAAARWLGFRLADSLGIATQTAFPFAAAYVWQLFGRVLSEVAAANPFDRAALQWRLLRLLGASAAPEVRRYLAGDDGTRACELADRLAALFERTLVERPDWIAAWSAGRRLGLGPDEGWQAGLWRSLAGELVDLAAEHPRERFFARLRNDAAARARLPRRISLWCVEAMPALYWEVFAGLAEWVELHVFVLAPSREYWGDIDRKREQLRVALEHPETALLYETGHPLLASLGRARQHAVVRLAETLGDGAEHAWFVAPPATLLGALQRDLLELELRNGAVADHSLQLHDCHGALREAEVLHDRLLDLFERLPGLQPSDILILTPDIETYAPLVEAVLTHAEPARRIPCAVADRPLAAAPLWRALRRLCTVAAGELDAESVMALLEEPALRRAFDIEAGDVPLLRDWVAQAGIRWAEDGRARRRRGLPADDAHTWRAGLRRLLLGVALPEAPERLWDGMLPAAGSEGSRAALLGRLIDFAEAVFGLSLKVGSPGTATEWSEILSGALQRFLQPDEAEEEQMQRLREALATLAARADAAHCVTPLPLAVLLRELDALLAEQASAQAFGGGRATIAALQPGRPLPARVLCLVGMNDGAWPRPAPQPGFDLLARHPRPGDRNRRGEERHAFLETLLCAGDALVVTYTGRDARSNVEQPPAAPLAELLDTLQAMTGLAAQDLVVAHPLQPFGAAYHDRSDARLFSYDSEHCLPGLQAPGAFLSLTAATAAAEELQVDLAQLQRFFANPARHFLRERLGIHLEESEELLETHEPFVPNKLEEYQLREACFELRRAGRDEAEIAGLLRARGWLPHGVAGELAGAAARAQAQVLWQRARPWREAEAVPAIDIDFRSGGVQLVGRLDGLTAQGLWRVRPGKTKARDRLRLWLAHLALQVGAPAGVARTSTLVAQDGVLALPPIEGVAALLADLLALWRDGQFAALPFYPESAWAWLRKGKCREEWEGGTYSDIGGERDDAYVRLALRDFPGDPLGESFQALARRILGPLQAACKGSGDD